MWRVNWGRCTGNKGEDKASQRTREEPQRQTREQRTYSQRNFQMRPIEATQGWAISWPRKQFPTKRTRVEIIQRTSSNYRRNDLQINDQNITRNSANIWECCNTLLSHPCSKERVITGSIKYFVIKDKKYNTTQFMRCN